MPPAAVTGVAAALALRAEAARRLGFQLEVLDPETGCLLAVCDGRRRRLLVAGPSPLNDAGAARLAGDKFYAARVLEQAGLRVPRSVRCLAPGAFDGDSYPSHTGLEGAFALARELGFPLVVKPNRGARGRDVAMVTSEAELQEAVTRAWRRDYLVLVQQRVPGFDLRVDLLDGELLLGYTRRPVEILGDGRGNLRQHLADWDRRFAGPAFETALAADPVWRRQAVGRGLDLDSVLPPGERLLLGEEILNLNRLCVANLLDGLPPAWLDHCREVGRLLHLRHLGIDFKVPGPAAELGGDPRRAVVLEVNASPSLGQTYRRGETEAAVAAEMKVLAAILETAGGGGA